MIDEPFARGETVIHRLDPRAKLTSCLLLSLVAALSLSYQAPLVVLLFAAILIAVARPPLGLLVQRIVAVNAFIAFLWLLLPLTTAGEPVYRLGVITITDTGLRLCLLVTLKSNAVFAIVLALISTSTAPALSHGMTALKIPPKLSFLFLFTYRYLHVIFDEYHRILTAARLRGFIPLTNLQTYRTYAAIVAMVLVRSYDRSHRVYQAMLLRGFCGTFHFLENLHAGPRDRVFILISFGVASIALWLSITWSGVYV